jgi:isopentenyldiphosphate isomerase
MKPVLIIVAFIGVFVAGGITGAVAGARWAQREPHIRASEQYVQSHMRRIADQIGLSPEQRKRIRPILTKAAREVQQHRADVAAILRKVDADVRNELTEEQRVAYDKLRERNRDKERAFSHWVREQRMRRLENRANRETDSAAPPATEGSSDTEKSTP